MGSASASRAMDRVAILRVEEMKKQTVDALVFWARFFQTGEMAGTPTNKGSNKGKFYLRASALST